MGRLDGKVAVITGANRGIGKATAKLFAEEGAKVVLAARHAESGEAVARGIVEAGGTAFFRATDLADMDDAAALIDDAITKYGRVDILVNNAGSDDPMAVMNVADVSLDNWDRVMDVNVKAPFVLSQRALPYMEKQGGGCIVNTCSIASTGAGRGPFIYTVSKHALLGLTRELQFYNRKNGIRVNAVLPGGVLTEMTEADFNNPQHPLAQAIAATPAGHPCQPEDLAKAILFLASDDSAYVYGTGLIVDGGGTCAF